jgi:cell division protease FtsH
MPEQTQPNKKSPEPNYPKPLGILVWIVLGASFLWFGYNLAWPREDPPPVITYSSFIAQVEAGNVTEVILDGEEISGTLTSAVTVVNGQALLAGEALPEGSEAAETKRTQAFSTIVPPSAEASVVEALQARGTSIAVAPASRSPYPAFGFSSTILLVVLAVVGASLLFRRMGPRPQGGVGDFGRARAQVIDPQTPQITFSDVAGEDQAKAELVQVVDFLRNPEKYRQMGARLPGGLLLVGPPGTGKTLLAKAVAGEANVPFFSISASAFVEIYVGVGASRVRDLFRQAKEAAPSIVFIDELDAVGRQRFAGIGGSNDEREQTLNQLLVELDGFEAHNNVVVMSATNRPDVLDPALLRPGRFDRQIALGLPDRRARESILRLHTKSVPLDPGVDLIHIARSTPGFSGADLANLVNEAALSAAQLGKPAVGRKDIDTALDRIVLGLERPLILSDHERQLLAYHEAGHAIAAHYTPGADPLKKISILPRGQALGMTVQLPIEDRVNLSRTYLLGRLNILLAGRASEQMVFDEMTTGAENDLKQATLLARQMVGLWGMSEEIGPFSLGMGEQHVFLGREIARERDISPAMLDRAEVAVQRLLANAIVQATLILSEYRVALDRVAEQLLVDETLEMKDFLELVEPHVKLTLQPEIEIVA